MLPQPQNIDLVHNLRDKSNSVSRSNGLLFFRSDKTMLTFLNIPGTGPFVVSSNSSKSMSLPATASVALVK